jgi:hypothetical protein
VNVIDSMSRPLCDRIVLPTSKSKGFMEEGIHILHIGKAAANLSITRNPVQETSGVIGPLMGPSAKTFHSTNFHSLHTLMNEKGLFFFSVFI